MANDIAEYLVEGLEGLRRDTGELAKYTMGLGKRLDKMKVGAEELPRSITTVDQAQELLQRLGRARMGLEEEAHVYDEFANYYIQDLPGQVLAGRDPQHTPAGLYAPPAFIDLTSAFYPLTLGVQLIEESYHALTPENISDIFSEEGLVRYYNSLALAEYFERMVGDLERLIPAGMEGRLQTGGGASSFARGITGGRIMSETEDRPNYVGQNALPVNRGDPKNYKETKITEIEMK